MYGKKWIGWYPTKQSAERAQKRYKEKGTVTIIDPAKLRGYDLFEVKNY